MTIRRQFNSSTFTHFGCYVNSFIRRLTQISKGFFMKISVVTISFNQAQYLRECIESVLSQKGDQFELEYIVVDPGSTDGSRDIIASYGTRLKPVLEKDQGPADGLNKGFAAASGDIVCYLNSDDILLPYAIELAASELQGGKMDVLHGNAIAIDEHGNTIRRLYTDKFSLIRAAYGASILIQPSSFIRRSAFNKTNGFNTKNRSNWDGELFVDLATSGATFGRSSHFYSGYRIHSESITGSGAHFEKHKQYEDRLYHKITGRESIDRSRALGWYFRYSRKILNFRDTLERLKHGPVFGTR